MPPSAFVLLLTDDEPAAGALRERLRETHGQACAVVSTVDDALASIHKRTPDAVAILQHGDNGHDLTEILAALRSNPESDTAILVPRSTREALPRERSGRIELLPPLDDLAKLAETISKAAAAAAKRRDDRLLRASLAQGQQESFEGLVGVTPAMRRIFERIRKAARNKLTVLILGETGTGKELIAEAIHRQSDRAKKTFLSLNCAGLSETLIESELFGHVRGAFTGAIADRKGYFAAADGGTLFLDEIGDMPLPMQAKLLRVLDKREFLPVGSTQVQRVDVRLIAATNAELRKKVDEKEFRDDLLYRLNSWVIEVPPLRERVDDIPLIAHQLVQEANRVHGLTIEGISSDALQALAKYYWPGNVRELRNVIEAAACDAERGQIGLEHLPEALRGSRELAPVTSGGLVGLTMEQVERLMIERTLQATQGNREQAAKMLNIGTRTLYRKIKEYGL